MAYLQLLPVLLLVAGLFLGGLAMALVQSLGHLPALGMVGYSLATYRAVLQTAAFQDGLWLSLRVGALATAGACIVGTVLAVCATHGGQSTRGQRFLMQLPLALPHLVMAYVILIFLAPTGLLARVLHAARLLSGPEAFPDLTYGSFGWGIILAYVLKEAPFAAILIYPLVGTGTQRLQAVAATLGASPWQALRHVVWPLIWPGLLTAGLIIFAFTIGDFELPYVLGRTYPRALSVLAYLKFTSIDLADRPASMALAIMLTGIAALAAALYLYLVRPASVRLGQARGERDD